MTKLLVKTKAAKGALPWIDRRFVQEVLGGKKLILDLPTGSIKCESCPVYVINGSGDDEVGCLLFKKRIADWLGGLLKSQPEVVDEYRRAYPYFRIKECFKAEKEYDTYSQTESS